MAQVLRARGRLAEALHLLESVRQAVEPFDVIHLRTQIELWLAELYLEHGEPAVAQEALLIPGGPGRNYIIALSSIQLTLLQPSGTILPES